MLPAHRNRPADACGRATAWRDSPPPSAQSWRAGHAQTRPDHRIPGHLVRPAALAGGGGAGRRAGGNLPAAPEPGPGPRRGGGSCCRRVRGTGADRGGVRPRAPGPPGRPQATGERAGSGVVLGSGADHLPRVDLAGPRGGRPRARPGAGGGRGAAGVRCAQYPVPAYRPGGRGRVHRHRRAGHLHDHRRAGRRSSCQVGGGRGRNRQRGAARTQRAPSATSPGTERVTRPGCGARSGRHRASAHGAGRCVPWSRRRGTPRPGAGPCWQCSQERCRTGWSRSRPPRSR